MARRLRVHLRSPFALVFALSLLALQSVAPTPPAMAGLVLIASMHVLAYLWVRLAASGLYVAREHSATPTYTGDAFTERFVIQNRAWVPLLWVELQDASALPGYQGTAVLSLDARSDDVIAIPGRALRRGVYALGPVVVTMGDPFGLLEMRLRIGQGARRVVYPRPTEIAPFDRSPGAVPSEGLSRQETLDRSLQAVTVRPYVPGDAPRRIHWRTTARRSLPQHDALFVKEFDPQATSSLWVVLDLQAAAQFGEGDASSEERAIVLAASLAHQGLQEGRGVGLLAMGASISLLVPRSGAEQRWRLLEELAGMRAEGDVPLADVLERLSHTITRGHDVAVIATALDDAWVEGVRTLLWRGAHVHAILLATEPPTATNNLQPPSHATSRDAMAAALADLGVPLLIVEPHPDPARLVA